jgi:hypothetical protein
MGERHAAPRAFDKTSQHSFDQSCTQGTQLDANSFDAYGIKREKNSEYTETDYPNGISVTRFKEGDFAIGFPANYKHHEDKNGLSKITDKNGKAIAYLSADGNLLVRAGDKVLQENKDGKVSLTETSCYKKPADAKQEHKPKVIVLPELVITGRVPEKPEVIVMEEMVITGRVPGADKKDDTQRKAPPKKAEPKPFNWDSDDPLEGIDVSGF